MDLDVFLSEQNIRRYRRLLGTSVTPAERKTIFELLAREMDALRSNAPRTANCGAPPNADWSSSRQHHQLSNELLRSQSPTP